MLIWVLRTRFSLLGSLSPSSGDLSVRLEFLISSFFNCHITEFIEIEHLTAILAFDVFYVFFAGYYANLGVFANVVHLGI